MTVHLHLHDRGILPKVGHQIVAIYDWLSGPPMTEHERVEREIAELETVKNWRNQSV